MVFYAEPLLEEFDYERFMKDRPNQLPGRFLREPSSGPTPGCESTVKATSFPTSLTWILGITRLPCESTLIHPRRQNYSTVPILMNGITG